MAGANADQIDYWNAASGQKWASDAEKLDAMMAPLTDAVLALAAAQPGEHVLDIGCGAGATALALAKAVGEAGSVTGLDVSRPMLEVARTRASGLRQLTFLDADAQVYPLPPAHYDLLFSKFGVMFFAAPQVAFVNLRLGMKPGARVAFVCWRALKDNPFATVPMGEALKHLPPQPPADPHAPGPFAFADPDRVRAILESAGFGAVRMEPFEAPMVIGRAPESAAKEAVLVGMASRLLKDSPQALKDKVIAALTNAYRPHVTPAGVTFPARVWLVSARAV